MKNLAILLTFIGLSACTQLQGDASSGNLCLKAAQHVADCTGNELTTADTSTCDQQEAEFLLGLTCNEVLYGPSDALADDAWGNRKKGEKCSVDWQCESTDGLVCRPSGAGHDVCLLKAQLGRLCNVSDAKSDCLDEGAVCQRTDNTIKRKDVGTCRLAR